MKITLVLVLTVNSVLLGFCVYFLRSINQAVPSLTTYGEIQDGRGNERPENISDSLWEAPVIYIAGGSVHVPNRVKISGDVDVDNAVKVYGEVGVFGPVDVTGKVKVDSDLADPLPVWVTRPIMIAE
jgi:hypothetical protein